MHKCKSAKMHAEQKRKYLERNLFQALKMHKCRSAKKHAKYLGRNLFQALKMHKCKSAKMHAEKKESIWGETYSRL
jgi:hypothetical protein